jgi:hypothetical protein
VWGSDCCISRHIISVDRSAGERVTLGKAPETGQFTPRDLSRQAFRVGRFLAEAAIMSVLSRKRDFISWHSL